MCPCGRKSLSSGRGEVDTGGGGNLRTPFSPFSADLRLHETEESLAFEKASHLGLGFRLRRGQDDPRLEVPFGRFDKCLNAFLAGRKGLPRSPMSRTVSGVVLKVHAEGV